MKGMSGRLPIEPLSDHVKTALKTLAAVFKARGFDYCLIGALARDIQFYLKGVEATRRTEDVDFAVLVPHWQGFEGIKKDLLAKEFTATNRPYRLKYDNTVFDILPVGDFGEELHFKESRETLSVFGLKEMVGQESFLAQLEGLSLPVLSLESLFLLKLISFHDAWPDRPKDADDLWDLLYNYWDIYHEEILAHHYDLLTTEDFDFHMIGAAVLGRKLQPILSQAEEVREKVLGILSQEVSAESDRLTRAIAKKLESRDVEKARAYLNAILSSI
jgi:predicted nucleotidyltransferase